MSFASRQPEALHSISLLAVPPIPNFKDVFKALPNFPRQLYMSLICCSCNQDLLNRCYLVIT